MKPYFSGYYFKHQKGDCSISFIVGRSEKDAFIQVITSDASYYIPYALADYYNDRDEIRLPGCSFSKSGINVHIQNPQIHIAGCIQYENLTPIRSDIMGIFRFFPMQCTHGITSMRHALHGFLTLNHETVDLDGGIGYIESDRGISFPKRYLWFQCSDFAQPSSVFASVADIPFWKFQFRGCIAVVYYEETEFRFATYLGVKILECNRNKLVLKQGKYRLSIALSDACSHPLRAPSAGNMTRTIRESISCPATVSFYKGSTLLLAGESRHASFEYVE